MSAAVSPEGRAEQTTSPLLELPGFRIGKRGIEKTLDDPEFAARAGASRVEVNAYGRVIRELEPRSRRSGR